MILVELIGYWLIRQEDAYRSKCDHESEIYFFLANCEWILNVFLCNSGKTFHLSDDMLKIIGHNHIHASRQIKCLNNPCVVLLHVLSSPVLTNELTQLSFQIKCRLQPLHFPQSRCNCLCQIVFLHNARLIRKLVANVTRPAFTHLPIQI